MNLNYTSFFFRHIYYLEENFISNICNLPMEILVQKQIFIFNKIYTSYIQSAYVYSYRHTN